MSTAPSVQPPTPVVLEPQPREIRIYSHSNLFYWWPVWAVGLIMGLITLVDGHKMVVVPKGSQAEQAREVQGHGVRDVIILPETKPGNPSELHEPRLDMARGSKLGVIFSAVLLLTIVITNVPLRGLWSVMIILFLLLLVVIFALADWWTSIVRTVALLDVRINAGGYFFIALVLLIVWALTVFVFDHRSYVAITSGQVRVCLAIGAGETVYDTTGMTFQKQQNDLFRHWIIGMGSGDLILHRTNTNQEIDLPNVLFVGAKIKQIEKLIKEKEVV